MRRRPPFFTQGLLAFLSIAFLAGCTAFDDGQAQGCFEQADCPVDSYCDDGVCLLRGEGTRQVIIESIRAIASDTPSQLTSPQPVTLSTLEPTRLTVNSGIAFSGTLVTPDDTLPSGRIEIERLDTTDPALPAQAPVNFGVYANQGEFSFRALPGTYRFTFSPDAVDGIGRPTFSYQGLVLSTENRNLEFSYPAQSRFKEVTGRVVVEGASQNYFEGASIQFSFVSANLSLRSAAVPIGADGTFQVTLPPNPSRQWQVEIPTKTDGRLGYNTIITYDDTSESLSDIIIQIPQFQTVRLRAADSLSDDYVGVRYELKTEKTSGTGVLRQRLKARNTANSSGWMEVSLLPSDYTVKVTPEDNPLYLPQEFPLCVSVDPDEIGCVTLEQRDSLFALPQGYVFQGIVKDVAGLAVSNVPVTVRDAEGDLITEALTDSRGQFSATVNMGQNISKVFEFGFQPNQSTEIPWHYVTQEVDINNDTTGIFSLPLGFAMSGLVIDEAQRPQTNTILRIFDVESLKLIAIASPGSEGYFTVFLANDGDQ